MDFSDEKLRELDGKDDGLLKGRLGLLQAGDVLPLDVRLLGDDGSVQRLLQLRILVLFLLRPAIYSYIVGNYLLPPVLGVESFSSLTAGTFWGSSCCLRYFLR